MSGNIIWKLAAKNASGARRECKQRWPGKDVKLRGYSFGMMVLSTLVRGATKGHVASVIANRSPRATHFEAEVVS